MRNAARSLLAGMLLVATLGCQAGNHSASGFRLPPDGSLERGKTTFIALGCPACHEVEGVALPQPPVPRRLCILLGGTLDKTMTDGYLVTSIIYPSYQLAPYPRDEITVGGESLMPRFAERMTVGQLTDIVAFLQSRYKVRNLIR